MQPLNMIEDIIEIAKREIGNQVKQFMGSDLKSCMLYGSCARGDDHDDSDIDIALLVNCDRIAVKKYTECLAKIATDFAIRYYAIINFVCIPYEEYLNKRTWYLYFKNIEVDGVCIDG